MPSFPENYPEEYIQWNVNFFWKDFSVTPDVLIPRLETEALVRRARQALREESRKILIDIGSGSGIIGTSLADLVDEVIFLDISPTALTIAKKNFRTHFPDKKAQFIVSDLLSNLPKFEENTEVLFVTNLPYIKDEDWKNMSADTIHEPKLALFGWEETGFELYEKLFTQFTSLPFSIHCIFEFGFDQRNIAEIELQKYPQWRYSFFSDYAWVERFGEILSSPKIPIATSL
jgi:release factor glutamine methyltransferase